MRLIKASQIYTNVVRVPPFGIRKCSVYSRSLDEGETVEMDNSFVAIEPYRGTLKFLTDIELKKIIIKPLVFQVIEEFTIENAYTADNVKDETYMKKGDKSRYRIDTGEAVVLFKMNFQDFTVTGHDGIIVPTNNRVATIDLTDPDGNGIYVAGGKTCEFEILVFDVTALRALKSVHLFSGKANDIMTFFKNERAYYVYKTYYIRSSASYVPIGYGNTALPYNLVLALRKLVENGKLPEYLLKTDVQKLNIDNLKIGGEEKVIYHDFGKPVDIIFTGYYMSEEFCQGE